LLRKIGSPDRIFRASLTELESCSLPARVAQAIHNMDAFKRAEKELAGVRNIPGCRLLNWAEPEYPQTLLQISNPPVLFYLRGDPQILNMPCLSIVGTRRLTLYGMARGIDAIGHQGALASNGRAKPSNGICGPSQLWELRKRNSMNYW
jgi:DNA processing protein